MSGKPARPRTRVGKYELGKTIGEGSFAKVKFAKNVENGEYVAIKILDRNHVLRHKMMEQARNHLTLDNKRLNVIFSHFCFTFFFFA